MIRKYLSFYHLRLDGPNISIYNRYRKEGAQGAYNGLELRFFNAPRLG